MHSLILEDELTSQIKLNLFLGPYGDVVVVATGKEALERIKEEEEAGTPFDLICLDINLPDTTGQAVLQTIRDLESEKNESHKKAIIFMVTSVLDGKNLSKAFYNLCNEYLHKPIVLTELEDKLKKYNLINS